jgi:hypothetical protein
VYYHQQKREINRQTNSNVIPSLPAVVVVIVGDCGGGGVGVYVLLIKDFDFSEIRDGRRALSGQSSLLIAFTSRVAYSIVASALLGCAASTLKPHNLRREPVLQTVRPALQLIVVSIFQLWARYNNIDYLLRSVFGNQPSHSIGYILSRWHAGFSILLYETCHSKPQESVR